MNGGVCGAGGAVCYCVCYAVENGRCLLEVLEMLQVIHCVLLCMLEAMEGGLHLLEVLEVPEVLDVPEVMRCVLLCC